MFRARTVVAASLAVLLVATAGCVTTGTDPGTPTPDVAGEAGGDTEIPTAPRRQQTGEVVVTVTDVVDGDTIDVRYGNGSTDTVRLLGIDTPEVRSETDPTEFEGVPDTRRGRTCLRAAGESAGDYATSRLLGEEVRLRVDPEADRRGYYGRLLAYVLLDGQNVNYELVEGGHARVYGSRFGQADRFYAAESTARDLGIGLWRCRSVGTATPTTSPPPSGSDGRLSIPEVNPDAPGNDHQNLNGEYVVFENTGSVPLSLSGWRIRDEAGHTYRVPDGVSLDPGARLRLYTGSGTDTAEALYWGSESAIWNNDGDTIVVLDSSGGVVLRATYG